MTVGLRTVAAGVAAALLLVVAPASPASATELTPDPAPAADPNGAPPMPPPMPAEGQPGSTAPPPAAGTTEAHLATSDVQDNGIGLKLFYVQPELGLAWATLGNAIPTPAVASVDYSQFRSGSGLSLGLGAGAEFITFQVGGRLRTMSTPHWNLWNAGGELLFQPGSGRFWPRFGVSAGYAWATKLDQAMCGAACGSVDISGLSLGLRGGFQYYLGKNLEVGADATLDYLRLSRPAVSGNAAFGADGSGAGVMLGVLGHVGLHLP